MSKPLKKMLSEDLRVRYAEVDSACVVDLTGLDVLKTRQMQAYETEEASPAESAVPERSRRRYQRRDLQAEA